MRRAAVMGVIVAGAVLARSANADPPPPIQQPKPAQMPHMPKLPKAPSADRCRPTGFSDPNGSCHVCRAPQMLSDSSRSTLAPSPADALIAPARNHRPTPRAVALLVTELQVLEALIADTPKGSPDGPQLLRRAAADYVELESAALRDKSQAIAAKARAAAIKYYTMFATSYPNDPVADQMRRDLAYEYEQAGDLENARKVYFALIKSTPSSIYVPEAYLAFAEWFYAEAQGDPSKWSVAAQAYQEVLETPPPGNRLWGYASYRLGHALWNAGDNAGALNAFKQTVDFTLQFPTLADAGTLGAAARHDLVLAFALVGNPARAFDFFAALGGDPSGSNDTAFRMMSDLGALFVQTGHYAEAVVIYDDLTSRDAADLDRRCGYATESRSLTCTLQAGDAAFVRQLCPELAP